MRTDSTRDAFLDKFMTCSASGLQQWLSSPAQCAYGGLHWNDSAAALSVHCALPLSALQQRRPEGLVVNIVLNSMITVEQNQQHDSLKPAWQGFLRVYNLLQFLPAAGFTTHSGAASGLYEPIAWRYADAVLNPAAGSASVAIDPALEGLLEEVLGELREALQLFAAQGGALPQVAFELQNDRDEIVAEAELAWPDQRLAGLLPEQMAYTDIFGNAGWRCIELDETNHWVEQALAWLKEQSND
jgi:DEAD/DEAH box helicase domain-containing protein